MLENRIVNMTELLNKKYPDDKNPPPNKYLKQIDTFQKKLNEINKNLEEARYFEIDDESIIVQKLEGENKLKFNGGGDLKKKKKKQTKKNNIKKGSKKTRKNRA